MMKLMLVGLLALLLMAAGCGVNKQYVADEIAASEGRTTQALDGVRGKTQLNADELAKLQQLSKELGEKADLAIDKASGFENFQIIWSGEVNFGFDSYDIDGVAASILDEAGMKLESVPNSLIELVGHTDQTGAAKYNLMMGEKRATSTKRYLADKFGISLYRMFVVSYGETKPLAMPGESKASSMNRRVNLAIWGPM